LLLAIPALLLALVLGSGFSTGSGQSVWFGASSLGGVAGTAAFLAWFFSLALGRAPRGLRDLTAYSLGYGAQAGGYVLLLTPRYPTSDPRPAEIYSDLPEHPVRIVVTDDLGRSRLTVLFRLLLAIPHFIWLFLWAIAAFFAGIAAWVATLVTGRVPLALHRFLAAYVRYVIHLFAFVYVIGRRFPGFTGRARSYGIDLEIDPPVRQGRWTVLFRFVLAFPAFLVASALGGVAFMVALLGWWYALFAGRMPEGMRNLGASCLRYSGQTYAYVFLLTPRYPYAAAVLAGRPAPPAATGDLVPQVPLPGDSF
jgi:hypothetical protein